MAYIGNPPADRYSSVSYQDLTGGTGTSFTLDYAVGSANEIEVFVNNVRQEPSVAYTVSGTALTMTGTIASTDDFYVVFQGKAQQTVGIPEKQSNGDYSFDNGTLFVDASANFVGINTTSPNTSLDVSGSGVPLEIDSTNSNTYKVQFKNNGTVNAYVGTTANKIWLANSSATTLATFDNDGLKFNGDTASANALNDYEEGTWTPALSDGTNSVSFPANSGDYVKIGKMVTVGFDYYNFSISSLSGALYITGIPFAIDVTRSGSFSEYIHIAGTSGGANTPVVAFVNDAYTSFILYQAVSSTAGLSALSTSDLASAISLRGRVTYTTS